MTSEVCVMNRLAVVLAADSATTVTGHKSANDVMKRENGRRIEAQSTFEALDCHVDAGTGAAGLSQENSHVALPMIVNKLNPIPQESIDASP